MLFTHAVIARLPKSLQYEDKKAKIDIDMMRKQQEDLAETLRESGVNVIELTPKDGAHVSSLFIDDAVVTINGTALICRPKKETSKLNELVTILSDLSWNVVECPQNKNGKTVILQGSDVLFTGKEIFVGIRKHGTNLEGAMVIGQVFCDLAVVPIMMSEKAHPLKYYVCLAAPNILAIGTSKEAQNILKRLEHEATFRYQTLTVDDDEAVSCLCINNRVVFRQDKSEPKFTALQSAGMELWALDVSELVKAGPPFSRYCLLIRQLRDGKGFTY